ncbi:hypothetical protein GGH94_005511 [Coemansia aciculifera]|uniref:Uncharacterized protein n=1 Tax=Coemansia aciculifera TaxID=417176 RepID=A0A9W8IIC2_9FUNG|nr:hypothetical protein GGH94_005511 [Coemansia aciculifera]
MPKPVTITAEGDGVADGMEVGVDGKVVVVGVVAEVVGMEAAVVGVVAVVGVAGGASFTPSN